MPLVVKEFPGIVIAEEPEWKDSIRGSNGVVNLAGVPISTRWSPEVGITCSFRSSISIYYHLPFYLATSDYMNQRCKLFASLL